MMDGADQSQRFPASLAPHAFDVEETPLSDFLTMNRRFADALAFVGADGRPSGTWGELFDRDESVLLAEALSLRLARDELAFLDDFDAGRRHRLAEHLGGLASWLTDWVRRLACADQPAAQALAMQIERLALQALGPEMIAAGMPPAERMEQIGIEITKWLAPWRESDSLAPRRAPPMDRLRVIYFAVQDVILRARSLVETRLPLSLGGGQHEPAAGLLIAFAQALRPLQAQLNQFTPRHLDFYYRQCLGSAWRAAAPDSVHLLFTRDPTFARSVTVPAGQRFLVPVGSGAPIQFAANDALSVTDAHVAALKTLRLERDPLISPEFEFGFVTRARAAEYEADVSPERLQLRDAAALMGGEVLGCLNRDTDARIGFAITSPLLWLKEGERIIDLDFEFEVQGEPVPPLSLPRPGDPDKPASEAEKAVYRQSLGRIFSKWLWSNPALNPLTAAERELLAAAPRYIEATRLSTEPDSGGHVRTIATDALLLLLGPSGPKGEPAMLERDRLILARDLLFGALFTIEVSTADGWRPIGAVAPKPEWAEQAGMAAGLGLRLQLTNEEPPITACSPAIHGAQWPTDAPVMRLTISDQAHIFPYSLFEQATLLAVSIAVDVAGARDVRVYNQLGQLDATKPLMMFGPTPNTAAYFAVGSPEAARKPLTRLALNLKWSGLPANGFSDYYTGYPGDFSDDAFTVVPSILRHGRWLAAGAERTLFADQAERLLTNSRIILDGAALRSLWDPAQTDLVLDNSARNGFVKLQLSGPTQGFGHQLYATVLADALRENMHRKSAAVLPNAPYTPLLDRLTIDYSAGTRILLGAGAKPDAENRLMHLHPFGISDLAPAAADQACSLLPRLDWDGQLLIGLSASVPQGGLSLLFELRGDTADEMAARKKLANPVAWSWLAKDQWIPLDDRRLLKDGTMRFLTTGLVELDLPPGLTRDNASLPGGLFWLRTACDDGSERFAGLLGVHAQGLQATRVLDGRPLGILPPNTIGTKSASLPGVLAIRQPSPSFGLRPAETAQQQQTRVGERLQHKNRASTSWDYERLVLEAFPDVYKVKCLAGIDPVSGAARPGQVLIVVAPTAPRNNRDYSTRALQLDALELERIAAYLPPLASPLAQITVRNAVYERIQVRCAVGLKPGALYGDVLQRINRALIEYLSPWHDLGHPARFDWIIRGADVETCIRSIPEVEIVSGISMVRVWKDDTVVRNTCYFFEDTAAEPSESAPRAAEGQVELHSKLPWSLALPMEEHVIEVLDGVSRAVGPQKTGIAKPPAGIGSISAPGVQIGTTFVVNGSQ
ncbi:MAG: hypothetical protein WA840_09570 [Caulobacteraceae bacterium]